MLSVAIESNDNVTRQLLRKIKSCLKSCALAQVNRVPYIINRKVAYFTNDILIRTIINNNDVMISMLKQLADHRTDRCLFVINRYDK